MCGDRRRSVRAAVAAVRYGRRWPRFGMGGGGRGSVWAAVAAVRHERFVATDWLAVVIQTVVDELLVAPALRPRPGGQGIDPKRCRRAGRAPSRTDHRSWYVDIPTGRCTNGWNSWGRPQPGHFASLRLDGTPELLVGDARSWAGDRLLLCPGTNASCPASCPQSAMEGSRCQAVATRRLISDHPRFGMSGISRGSSDAAIAADRKAAGS
jgi:hypothetical protein